MSLKESLDNLISPNLPKQKKTSTFSSRGFNMISFESMPQNNLFSQQFMTWILLTLNNYEQVPCL